MKISICVPQYNRINYLLRSLKIIEEQTYSNIEIVISDDCSTDDTVEQIETLKKSYKYPIIFSKNEVNKGYDYNYRKCIELSTGDYAFVIGNDDSLVSRNDIQFLVNFLESNAFPDIGFCNMLEERTDNTFIQRATHTGVIGKGENVALRYYSCFSFVGGLIYKKSVFEKFNTDKYDGSIYSQMYLGVLIVASDNVLFSIKEPLVLKDILLDGKFRNSYRDRLAKAWKDYKVVDGGLPSVMNVIINALRDAGKLTQKHVFYIFKRMYGITYPHWLLDYRENGAMPASVGLLVGLIPHKNMNYSMLNSFNKLRIWFYYMVSSTVGLLTPVFIFKKMRQSLYTYFKG